MPAELYANQTAFGVLVSGAESDVPTFATLDVPVFIWSIP